MDIHRFGGASLSNAAASANSTVTTNNLSVNNYYTQVNNLLGPRTGSTQTDGNGRVQPGHGGHDQTPRQMTTVINNFYQGSSQVNNYYPNANVGGTNFSGGYGAGCDLSNNIGYGMYCLYGPNYGNSTPMVQNNYGNTYNFFGNMGMGSTATTSTGSNTTPDVYRSTPQSGTLSKNTEGINYTTTGGWKININGTTIQMTSPDGQDTTKVWGDPHVVEADGSKWDWDSATSSYLLSDGTKITMNAAGSNKTVDSTSIYDKAQLVQVNNKDMTFTSSVDWKKARDADKAESDGTTYTTKNQGNDWTKATAEELAKRTPSNPVNRPNYQGGTSNVPYNQGSFYGNNMAAYYNSLYPNSGQANQVYSNLDTPAGIFYSGYYNNLGTGLTSSGLTGTTNAAGGTGTTGNLNNYLYPSYDSTWSIGNYINQVMAAMTGTTSALSSAMVASQNSATTGTSTNTNANKTSTNSTSSTSQAKKAGALSKDSKGIHYKTTGGWHVTVNGTTIKITSPDGKDTTTISGDTKTKEADGSKWDWKSGVATFKLPDGTKITMDSGKDGVIDSTMIYDKDEYVKVNNHKMTFSSVIDAAKTKAADKAQSDGRVYTTKNQGNDWTYQKPSTSSSSRS